MCKVVVVSLPKLTIAEDFLPLELGSVDLILGMQWFHTMEAMEVDWTKLTMTFKLGNRKVTIRGDPSLTKAKVSLKMLAKSWQPAH